ncbi:hypothetical protein LT989_10205 [Citrobacter portucalensis]|nr:hypothetical protein [Citrobacter portucalensis]UHD38974.1 hypothetical protein LT989_10205 [Citrobacter portucalensis]
MDEKNGCLRMAGKLRQQADHNGTLTPIQIRYLKTFCSSAKDVQGIKAELDRALNFEKAQKKAYDEEMAKNEPAGRCERRLMADNARELLADAAQFSLQRPTTYSLHDVLLKELNTRLMFGTLNEAELKSLVKNYCVKQENHEPNIAIGDNWSRSQRVIYNVVK